MGQQFEIESTRTSNARHIRVKRASYFPIFSARHLQITRARQCAWFNRGRYFDNDYGQTEHLTVLIKNMDRSIDLVAVQLIFTEELPQTLINLNTLFGNSKTSDRIMWHGFISDWLKSFLFSKYQLFKQQFQISRLLMNDATCDQQSNVFQYFWIKVFHCETQPSSSKAE